MGNFSHLTARGVSIIRVNTVTREIGHITLRFMRGSLFIIFIQLGELVFPIGLASYTLAVFGCAHYNLGIIVFPEACGVKL